MILSYSDMARGMVLRATACRGAIVEAANHNGNVRLGKNLTKSFCVDGIRQTSIVGIEDTYFLRKIFYVESTVESSVRTVW
jgi:hypothetical protein